MCTYTEHLRPSVQAHDSLLQLWRRSAWPLSRICGWLVTLAAAPPKACSSPCRNWPQKNPWWSSISQSPQPKEPRSASPGGHRMRILLHDSSTPHCHLPNDQLSGLPRGRLSQRQLENCWGNILFYWKWSPSNCPGPDLDCRLTNSQ